MRLLRDTFFFTVSITLFAIDLLNSQIAILMAFLAKILGLSNADIGLVTGGYMFVSAIFQPVFGLVIDKVGPRWIASGGLFWTAGLISIALILLPLWLGNRGIWLASPVTEVITLAISLWLLRQCKLDHLDGGPSRPHDHIHVACQGRPKLDLE